MDDHAVDRLSGGDDAAASGSASDRVITSGIAWRGGEKPGVSVRPPRRAPAREARPGVIVGSSRQARELREKIDLYADDLSPVLVVGETGVGKELVARELHRLSARAGRPFVPVNAGAIPESLAASELFGHAKGAFTGAIAERDGAFQLADSGVLLVDEIGDMPASIQAQLLRVLDDGVVTRLGARAGEKVDIRLVAATNVDLRRNVASGAFRRDLYHRIAVLQIDVPSLRERGDDIVEIAESIIRAHPREEYRAARLTPFAADKLRSHRYPGNVRELKNVIMRALVHAGAGRILAEHIVFPESSAGPSAANLDMAEAKELMGRLIVLKALKQTDGNVTRAAALTGRTRSTFHSLKKQIDGDDFAAQYEDVCARIRALMDVC